MGNFVCQRSACGQTFKSKHSIAKYCSRSCSNQVNVRNIVGARRPRRFTNDEIVEVLQDLAVKLGRTPSSRDFEKHVGMSSATVQHHFGSYNRAVELAGLVPNLPAPPTFTESERLVPWSMRFRILSRDGFRCTYCGGSPREGYILHVDHKTARSMGGLTNETNLRTACHVCNMGKGTHCAG